MKMIYKKIIAILCAICILFGIVFNETTGLAETEAATVTSKETLIVPYTSAPPRTAPTDVPEGYVFAGWYQEEACKTPLTTAGAGYAKFVDENIFRAKAQITADSTGETDLVDIRLVTSVDTIYYSSIGFEITINGKTKLITSKNIYEELYSVGETEGELETYTPAEIFCSASKYFQVHTIEDVPNIAFNTVISVRVCITTQDGTVVYGQRSNKTINMGIYEKETIDNATLFSCDDKDYLVQDGGTATIDQTDYKEGAGSLSVDCNETDVLVKFNRGTDVIDISDYSDGYLHLWIYVNDVSYLNGAATSGVYAELSSGGASDVEELQWGLVNLSNGWNEFKLPFASATKIGTIDYEEVDYLRIYLNGYECTEDLVVKVDDIRAVSDGEFLNCDTKDEFSTADATVSVVENHYQEGCGALQSQVTGLRWYEFKKTSAVDFDAYAKGRLEFWLYINNTANLSEQLVYVELSSSGTCDNNELEWRIDSSDLVSGWNHVSLPIGEPTKTTGMIELSAVNYFRIWHPGTIGSLITILDDVRAVGQESQMMDTMYNTEDIVIADIIPTEAGYAVDKTGATDSTEGIQAALNDCAAAGGGTVYLKAGTYTISGTIDIPSHVTLRGDWRDPDTIGTDYGTVICVDVEPVDDTDEDAVTASECTGIFTMHGISGAVGLTVYYPNQSVSDVKIYPWTFYVVSGMLPTIRNVTVINGYRGIGAAVASVYGESVSHESLQIDNFKGTFLDTAIYIERSADVGTGKNISISNQYWLDCTLSGVTIPEETDLDAYTQLYAVGIKLGAAEWTEFTNISIEDCKTGIWTVEGSRSANGIWFAGSFYDLQISDCVTGVQADYLDTRWGMNIARSTIAATSYGVVNNINAYNSKKAYIQLCDVSVSGSTTTISGTASGYVVTDSADLSAQEIDYTDAYVTPDTRMVIANLNTEKDASAKLQDYLDYMGQAGGGVVYVPAGVYFFKSAIKVPASVELRGCSSVATRTLSSDSVGMGTIFQCYYGDEGGSNKDAFVTLNGENAGINGIKILYSNNGIVPDDSTNTTRTTSYAVRGDATGVYIVNSMIAAAAYGVDFRDCDNHYIEGVYTCCYYNTYMLGGEGGTITGCLQNPTVLQRTQVAVNTDTWYGSVDGVDAWHVLFGGILRRDSHYIILNEATEQTVYNNFAYGSMTMLTNLDSTDTLVVNIGTDMLGPSSAQLVMDGGSMYGINILRCNTTTSEATQTPLSQYVPEGIASESFKYIDGDLTLRNRLTIYRGDGEIASDVAVVKAATDKTGSAKKTILTDEKETSGSSTVRNVIYLDSAVDLVLYEEGAIHLKLYVNDVSYLSGTSSFYLELSSARRYDCEELQWTIPVGDLTTGWNEIVLPFDEASKSGIVHVGAIDYLRLYCSGSGDESLVTILDDVCAVMSDLTSEGTGGNDSADWDEWFQ